MVGWSISTMPVDFLKGTQSEASRVVSADTTGEAEGVDPGEVVVSMPDLVAIDSRADVIASVVDDGFVEGVANVIAVEGNDVTISVVDSTDGAPIEEADLEIAINARGF